MLRVRHGESLLYRVVDPTKRGSRDMARTELMHSKHRFRPEDTLAFLQMTPFARIWDDLGLSMVDLHELEAAIMAAPKSGRVVWGTRGLRKLRFVPEQWNMGKRGALRVCYVFLEVHKLVLLALIYPKNQKDTLTTQEAARINRAIESIEMELDR